MRRLASSVGKGVSMRGLVLCCVAAFASIGAGAQESSSPSFRISGFELTGDIPIPSSDTTRILAPFISNKATIETLQQASAALEASFKEQGYVLHKVSLPPQEVGDKVTLAIVKFVVGKIEVEGGNHFSVANVRASVPELAEGGTPSFKRLAVQTAIANENPSKKVQVGLRESEEPDRIDVRLQVADESPWSLVFGANNTGSQATGNDRVSLVAGHNNLFGLDHQASLAYTSSVERSAQVKQYGLNYRIPLYSLGGVVFASHTNSDVVGQFGAFSSSGAGQTFGLGYSHYLEPHGGRRAYVTLAMDDKQFSVAKINGVPVPGQVERSSRPITLSYSSKTDADASVYGYSVGWARNTDIGSSSGSLVAYQNEDPRIQSTQWSALRGDWNWAAGFGNGWAASVRGQYQWSNEALLSGEQFGLGGSSSVRGTSERAIAGDSGVFTSVELSTPEIKPGLRFFGFLDGGVLSSNNTSASASKVSHDSLASVGFGLRYGLGVVAVSAEYGRLIKGAELPATVPSGLPMRGDDKLHVNLTARF